jgi:hypothetical protein
MLVEDFYTFIKFLLLVLQYLPYHIQLSIASLLEFIHVFLCNLFYFIGHVIIILLSFYLRFYLLHCH